MTREGAAQRDDVERNRRQSLNVLVGKQVLDALGAPGDLWTIQVRPLWEGYYRVNVFVGAGTGAVRVAHSYFLIVDGDGNVTESSPTLTRRY